MRQLKGPLLARELGKTLVWFREKGQQANKGAKARRSKRRIQASREQSRTASEGPCLRSAHERAPWRLERRPEIKKKKEHLGEKSTKAALGSHFVLKSFASAAAVAAATAGAAVCNNGFQALVARHRVLSGRQ